MGWIWLDAPRLDFGRPDAEEWEGERTVWIYADPHTVLGVPASADEGELQRRNGTRGSVSRSGISSAIQWPLGTTSPVTSSA